MMDSDKLFGQERALQYLRNAFESAHLSHAYVLSGERGLGKHLVARAFAQAIVCENSTFYSECLCHGCRKVTEHNHPDVLWIGLDDTERSIKLETIRSMQSWVALRPLEAKRKVCIVNYAERLTEEAANAFLKTLEEPPQNVFIVFIVEQAFHLLDTIVSRMVEIRLEPLPAKTIESILTHEYGITHEAHFIAHQSQGSLGRALEYARADFFRLKNELLDSFLHNDKRGFFLDLVREAPAELDSVLYFLCGLFHDLLLLKNGIAVDSIINQDRIDDVRSCAEAIASNDIVSFMTMLEGARRQLKRNVNAKLILMDLALESESLEAQSQNH
jgi:DNA polymerase III subunit delta'